MEELVRTAERILSGPLGRHAALRPERVWDGSKSTVLRCGLLDAAPPTPPSVIVKRSKHGAILEDWAALLFLEQVPRDPPFAPRCYGGDLAAEVIVLEDLGDGEGPGTRELLLGDDPDRAAAALVEHLRLVGELHGATAGRADAYARVRRALGPPRPPRPLYKDPWSDARGSALTEQERLQAIREYRGSLEALGLRPPAAADEEIDRVTRGVEGDPG